MDPAARRVRRLTSRRVEAVARDAGRIAAVDTRDGEAFSRTADVVLVVVGVRPNTSLLSAAGVSAGAGCQLTSQRADRAYSNPRAPTRYVETVRSTFRQV